MGSKSNNYGEDMSNGESNKGNDTSLIVNVNQTPSDNDDDQEEYSYSEVENHESLKKESSSKKSRNHANSSKRRFVPYFITKSINRLTPTTLFDMESN